ncbi:GAL3ST1 [Lepeophtheirus salmonis]|uniref:GAL3ST1 n=1 Tax=Lepeophtheirus salmonis TaxID=72036 RepID=A0A7R8H5P6_LEPSM|nr:GAL3ST1 [Lepeophtheirus salmonis]CAF2887286.1 GAL3ST1 [Lepeophtheirus salmonis]
MRCYKIGYTLLLVLIMVSCAFISLILKDSSPPLIKLVAEEECVYKSKIVFVKTHKTGGSTLQNILFRYGYLQDLVFALPPQGWMYSLDKGFEAEMAKGNEQPWSKYFSMDVFAFHSRFNIDELRKVISDPIVLTILRDPVETFESNYVYMGLSSRYNGSNINEKHDEYIRDYGVEKINKEVRLLREKNRELIKTCSVKLSSRIFTSTEFRPESDLVYGYYMNESMKNCMHYGRTEPSFVRLIRTKQLAKTFLHSYSHKFA